MLTKFDTLYYSRELINCSLKVASTLKLYSGDDSLKLEQIVSISMISSGTKIVWQPHPDWISVAVGLCLSRYWQSCPSSIHARLL